MGERAFKANGLDNENDFPDDNHHGKAKGELPIETGPSEPTRADLVEKMRKWFGSKPLDSEEHMDTTNYFGADGPNHDTCKSTRCTPTEKKLKTNHLDESIKSAKTDGTGKWFGENRSRNDQDGNFTSRQPPNRQIKKSSKERESMRAPEMISINDNQQEKIRTVSWDEDDEPLVPPTEEGTHTPIRNIRLALDPSTHDEEVEGWDLPTRIPHSIEQCAYPESKYNTNETNKNKMNTNEMKTIEMNTYEMNRKANEMPEIETPPRLGDNQRIMREISKKLNLLRRIGKALGAITLLRRCLFPKRDVIRWASGRTQKIVLEDVLCSEEIDIVQEPLKAFVFQVHGPTKQT